MVHRKILKRSDIAGQWSQNGIKTGKKRKKTGEGYRQLSMTEKLVIKRNHDIRTTTLKK